NSPSEPARMKDHAPVLDGHEQIAKGYAALARRARAAEARDLVLAQHRPSQDVDVTGAWEVDDLGEHRVRIELLLGTQVLLDHGLQVLIRVAEASEKPGPGRSVDAEHQHSEPATSEGGRRA